MADRADFIKKLEILAERMEHRALQENVTRQHLFRLEGGGKIIWLEDLDCHKCYLLWALAGARLAASEDAECPLHHEQKQFCIECAQSMLDAQALARVSDHPPAEKPMEARKSAVINIAWDWVERWKGTELDSCAQKCMPH